uniref:Glutathione peroxidase 4 n=1 Tax=Nothobranchius korthausae TaxID=1143690 RepID=A0A1A8G1W7_9TELE
MRPLYVVLGFGAVASSGTLLAVILYFVLSTAASSPTEDWQRATSIYDFNATDIDGNLVSLEKYRGYVVIITNVASK